MEPARTKPPIQALIIDDDEDFREFLAAALEQAGIGQQNAHDAPTGLERLRSAPGGTFDLILLDVEMPGPSGWDLLHELRESGDEIPVVFVTGRESTEERVKGLRLGADDYVTKPIEADELVARVEAVIRRRRALTPIEFGDLRIDLAHRKIERRGHSVDLTPREFDLLLALAKADGATVSRATLFRDVWDLDSDPGTALLDVHLGRVRKKLDRHGRPVIRTVKGEGYYLVRHERDDG